MSLCADLGKFGGLKCVGVQDRALTLKRQEFRILNNTQKTKENDVKTILFSLVYLTPIKLPFCMSTGKRERVFRKKKKKSKSVRNHFTVKYSLIKNGKKKKTR